MFSLVQFGNEEYNVLPSKRIKLIKNKKCIVKFKGGAKYEAYLIKTADAQQDLICLQEKLNNRNIVKGPKHKKLIKTSNEKKLIMEDQAPPSESNTKNEIPSTFVEIPNTLKKFKKLAFSTPVNRKELNNIDSIISNISPSKSLIKKVERIKELMKENNNYFIQDQAPASESSTKNEISSTFVEASNASNKYKKLAFSTPVNRAEINNIDSTISTISSSKSFSINTPESSPPSGFTDILSKMGDSWLKDNEESGNKLTEITSKLDTSSNISNYNKSKENDNVSIISTHNNALTNCNTFKENNINIRNKKLSFDESKDSDNGTIDSDYYPEESLLTETISSKNDTESISKTEHSSLLDESVSLDVRTLKVSESKSLSKRNTKKHFCLFCHSLQSKFARHLILKHNNHDDVKKIINIPKSLPERRALIDAIRKKGDFLHNVKAKYNTGILIASRQQQEKYKNTAEDYVCCKNCKGFFSKKTIRIHFTKCEQFHKKGVRNITAAGRRITGYIHSKAESVLRRVVFPVLRDDKVTRSIKYDELIIIYGNKLCNKYTLDHQHDMIRAQLRLLGRYKLAIQAIDSEVTDFASIFRPQRFDSAINALRVVAHWDTSTMWFKTPAVAQNLTTLIKKLAYKFRTECIKIENYSLKKSVEDFLLLWEEEVPILINKKALEDQVLQKRQKKILLPSKQDIKLLFDYLKEQASISYISLQKKFDKADWTLLNQCTLILIQIFNRRRAGEIERLKLIDFQNKEALDENINKDLCINLSAETLKYAKQYVRLTLRGKLSRTVSVLLSPFVVKYIEILMKFRKQAGIKSDNEYVFAVSNTNPLKKKYIRACPLMRKFSYECGALIPSALRGTALRKHIATFTAMLDIEDTRIDRLANFMGHHKEIHKSIYRVPVPVAEMTDVSRLLVAAMGGDEEEHGESEDQISNSSDEENSEVPDSNLCKKNYSSKKKRTLSSKSINSSDEIKRRSTSPYGKTKRQKWSSSEKNAIICHFGELKNLKKLPSLSECQTVIRKYKVLSKRQPQQLKSFIDNQRRAESRRELYAQQNQHS